MEEQVELKNYDEVAETLKNSQNNHLLLGNGFNNSLSVGTSYKDIFTRMQENYQSYSELEKFTKTKCGYDIEKLIKKLQDNSKSANSSNDEISNFMPNFIEDKIKQDFMKATYSIVREKIKDIYGEKSDGIYLLFKNFTNYFTLNYDPFLYLLLMRFKKSSDGIDAIIFSNSRKYRETDMNESDNNIYKKIKGARRDGRWEIIGDDGRTSSKKLSDCTKTEIIPVILNHFKDEGWNKNDVNKVVGMLIDEERNDPKQLRLMDGFDENIFHLSQRQNIFFLHGAFHLYRKKEHIHKITQTQEKPLYQALEDIIDNEEKDILCVLTGTSEEKEEEIQRNEYLKICFNKLSSLQGSLVIIGSSLDKNDSHIFKQIDKSNLDLIYIASSSKNKSELSKKTKCLFPNKKVVLFNRDTVPYNKKPPGIHA